MNPNKIKTTPRDEINLKLAFASIPFRSNALYSCMCMKIEFSTQNSLLQTANNISINFAYSGLCSWPGALGQERPGALGQSCDMSPWHKAVTWVTRLTRCSISDYCHLFDTILCYRSVTVFEIVNLSRRLQGRLWLYDGYSFKILATKSLCCRLFYVKNRSLTS